MWILKKNTNPLRRFGRGTYKSDDTDEILLGCQSDGLFLNGLFACLIGVRLSSYLGLKIIKLVGRLDEPRMRASRIITMIRPKFRRI